MFIFFILLTVISFASIQLISPIEKQTQLQFNCNHGVSDLKFCSGSLDHCAADLLSHESNATAFKVLKFDVSSSGISIR